MSVLRLQLLGGFGAWARTGVELALPRRKVQGLLAYLAIQPGRVHPRDKLAALLWPDVSDQQARQSLRQVLATLRRALPGEPAALRATDAVVALDPGAVAVDVAAFERAAALATPAALEEAGALYRGDLLAGLTVESAPFEEWLVAERERLREQALAVLAKLLALQRRAGSREAAIQTALKLLALDPLQEAVHRTLMRLYAEHERPEAALRQYRLCVDVLRRELAAEPEADTQQLYREIVRDRQADDEPGAAVPLVGRAAEMATLGAALEAALRGRSRIVAILGEAGIGKTRLVEELAAAARSSGAQVVLGHAYPAEQILPFAVWVDGLRRDVVSQHGALAGLEPVWRTALARLLPEVESRAPAVDDSPDHVRLFEAVTRAIEHLAAAGPMVLALEDLHWADEMSLRLLAYVARRLDARRVLLVATTRIEGLAQQPLLRRLMMDRELTQRLVRVDLDVLSPRDTERLAHLLVQPGGDTAARAALVQEVGRASEGRPFLLTEIARAQRAGTLRSDGRRLHPPERVRELIRQRLDDLPAVSREVLSVASVIGRRFAFSLLTDAAATPADAVAGAVEDLVDRRLLRHAGDDLDFAHEMLREVAYAEIQPHRRRLFHAAVARGLERAGGDAIDDRLVALGHHCREAGLWDGVADYFRRAGKLAATRGAHRDAVASFEQARAALARLPATRERRELDLDLRFDLRNSLVPLGMLREVGRHLDEARALAAELGDRQRLGWVSLYLAFHALLVVDHTRALEAGRHASAIAEEVGDDGLEVNASYALVLAHHALGEHREVAELARRVVGRLAGARARERFHGPSLPAVVCRSYLGMSLAEIGDFDEAVAVAEDALRLAWEVDHRYSVTLALFGLGVIHLRRGEVAVAAGHFEQGHALAAAGEFAVLLPLLSACRGIADALSGDLVEGVRQLEAVAAEPGPYVLWQTLEMLWLAEACVLAGTLKAARAAAERALALAEVRQEGGLRAWTLCLLGEIVSRAGDASGSAERYLQEALGLAEKRGMRPLVAHCRAALGRLATRDGREAGGEHLAAVSLYRELGMRPWPAFALEAGAAS